MTETPFSLPTPKGESVNSAGSDIRALDVVGNCSRKDNKPSQFALDGSAHKQFQLARRAANLLLQSSPSAETSVLAQQAITKSKEFYASAWTEIWGVPVESLNCNALFTCTVVSFEDALKDVRTKFAAQFELIDSLASALKNAGKGSAARSIRRRSKTNNALGLRLLDSIPATTVACS